VGGRQVGGEDHDVGGEEPKKKKEGPNTPMRKRKHLPKTKRAQTPWIATLQEGPVPKIRTVIGGSRAKKKSVAK